jgi:hypothetical protein
VLHLRCIFQKSNAHGNSAEKHHKNPRLCGRWPIVFQLPISRSSWRILVAYIPAENFATIVIIASPGE